MRYFASVFSYLLLLSLATVAHAENMQKMGYINTERVYRESAQAVAISEMLQKEFAERRTHLQDLAKEGVALEEALDNPKTKQSQKHKLQAAYQQKQREYALLQQQFAQDYSLRRNEEFAALQYRANQVISDLAREEGYDVILQDVVYIHKKFDITDKVIDALNHAQ